MSMSTGFVRQLIDSCQVALLDSHDSPIGSSMYDLRALRDNLDGIREQLGPRGADVQWDMLRKLLEERRIMTGQVEQLRHELKKGSDVVAKLKREKQPADAAVAAMKAVGERITQAETGLRDVETALADLSLRIPNLPHSSVPAGKDSSSNVEVRRVGDPPRFSGPYKSHCEIGESLGILDLEPVAKITGARFAVLT